MKSATVAAAAAGLIGSALADGWESWSSSAAEPTYAAPTWTPTTPVSPETTAAGTWTDWSAASSTPVEPETTAAGTWTEWSASSTTPVNPETPSETWSEWAASSTTPVNPETPAQTWSEWSASSTTPVNPETPAQTWSEWSASSTTPVNPETPAQTWSEWSASSTSPVSPQSTAETWSNWDPASSTTWEAWTESVTTTVIPTTTYVTVTVYPVSTSETWSAWTSSSTANPATTQTWSAWSSSSSPVSPVSTSSGAWDPWTAQGQCAIQVSTSYGQPTWNPTPEVSPVSSSTWSAWTSSSASPVNPASTNTWSAWSSSSASPVSPASTNTWSEWSASSTANPASTNTWSEWSASSTANPASTNTWSEWSASSTANPATTGTWSAWSSSTAAATATGWSSWTTGSVSAGTLSTNGNKLGMTYSPYTANGGCKAQDVVTADIAKIASLGFTSVRVYSTDCSTLEFVGAAAKASGLKLILGVYISSTGTSGAQGQVQDIVSWAQWDLVELIVVGNEAIFNNYCTASELAAFITSSKAAFSGAGYQGLVTTTEELSVWQSSGSALCDVIDITGANLYAFFNADTTADQAGTFIQAEITELQGICPGKEVYAMECGWPTAGECNGVACPSPENQKTALTAIQQVTGAKIVFFSFEDEQWKEPGPLGVEQHWGCADVF